MIVLYFIKEQNHIKNILMHNNLLQNLIYHGKTNGKWKYYSKLFLIKFNIMSKGLTITATLFVIEKKTKHLNDIALLVGEYTKDEEIITAAILHDIMHHTDVQVEELYPLFGHHITETIELLTENIKEITEMGYINYMCKHVPILPDDALLIKLAQLYLYNRDPLCASSIITVLLNRKLSLTDAHKDIIKKWHDKMGLLLI